MRGCYLIETKDAKNIASQYCTMRKAKTAAWLNYARKVYHKKLKIKLENYCNTIFSYTPFPGCAWEEAQVKR